jgi:putative DNA primase/helicase
VTLDSLADEPRWVAWRSEERGGRLTKIPYSPGGGKAKADDPSTWGTRAEAEAGAQRLVNGLGGGIGIELGDLGFDIYLGGLDLDSCIAADGTLAPWAAAILDAVPSYGERSPSDQGIKLFFYIMTEHVRPFLNLIGVENWGTRRSIGENSADHGPAVECYL